MGSYEENKNNNVDRAHTNDDLFDVKITMVPAKRPRCVRKRKNANIESKHEVCLKICYCRYCQTDESDTPQNMGLIQIVKGCVVKILHQCILGCLKNEDQMDFMDENNLIKRLCSQISIPQIVWVIINISDKMDKLYFTRDTLQEVINCIQSIEKSKDPYVLMTKMRKDLPIHVKRMICQEVSDIYYKIMLL
ncbi:hypothetical protein E2320_022850 [Naja naja]|nr:hypothetical protein E2320_022850 [Naja naja]